MTEQLGEKRCPFREGKGGAICSTTKAFPVAKEYVTSVLQEQIRMADVPDWLCGVGGADCPVQSDLMRYGPNSVYAKPT